MLRLTQMKSLRKFASVCNHFIHEHHLVERQTYEERRSAALAGWQVVASKGYMLVLKKAD